MNYLTHLSKAFFWGMLAILALGVSASVLAAEGSATANGFNTQTKKGTCVNNTCDARFQRVPVRQNFIVTQVSCSFSAPTADVMFLILSATTDTGEGIGPTTHLTPVRNGRLFGQTNIFSSNERVLHVFKSGQIPKVLLSTVVSPANGLECTLAGQLFGE